MEWTREEETMFEQTLVLFPEVCEDRFESIAIYMKKPLEEVKHYYDALVHDVALIESGRVGMHYYPDYLSPSQIVPSRSKPMENERKRGTSWTEEEHKNFLVGLERCGKGDWKNIARDYVLTRTPSQIASHAQKYYMRQDQKTNHNKRRRTSIHDTTASIGTC